MITRESYGVVLVDIDTLADTRALLAETLQAQMPGVEVDREQYSLANMCSGRNAEIREIVDAPGFVRDLGLTDGALYGLNAIIRADFWPRIISRNNREQERRAWVREHLVPHFGEMMLRDGIFAERPGQAKGIAYVSDTVNPVTTAQWEHITFGRPYNQKNDGLRIAGWQDPTLEETLHIARERCLRDTEQRVFGDRHFS